MTDWFKEFDGDIAEYAMSKYNQKRGPGNRWDHNRALQTARATASMLQEKRDKGHAVSVNSDGYGITRKAPVRHATTGGGCLVPVLLLLLTLVFLV